MSLLLDALKSADAKIGVPEEESLDARATLELLAPRPAAQSSLALSPILDVAAARPGDLAPEPRAAAAPVAAAPPGPERAPPLTLAGASEDINTAPPAALAAMAQSNTRSAAADVPAKTFVRKYGPLLAIAATIAGIAMLGHSLWPFGPGAVVDVTRRQAEPPPASTVAGPAPSLNGVQVSSARPADQFAYEGNAPEIDLRDAGTATASPILPTAAPPPPPPERIPTPAIHPAASLSVARTEGATSIDRHVEAGYRALGAGEVATAQTEYAAALELDPNNVDAMLGMATVAARDGRPKAAAAAYATVLKLEPGNPDATAAMAMLGSSGPAADFNESRLKILITSDDGGRPALHAALGGIYAADGRWTDAAQEYFVALGKDPGNPDLAFDVAASFDQNRNPAAALKFYAQALAFARQRPTQIDLHAVEQRIGQLQARAAAQASAEAQVHGAPGTP